MISTIINKTVMAILNFHHKIAWKNTLQSNKIKTTFSPEEK